MNSFQIDNFSLDETWNSGVYNGNIWAAVLRFIPLENKRKTDSQFDFPLKYGTTYRIGQFMSCMNSVSPSDQIPQVSDIQAELTISDYVDDNHPFFFIMSHHPGMVKLSKRLNGKSFPLKPNIQYQVLPGDFIRFKEFTCVICVEEGGELEYSPSSVSSHLNSTISSNSSTHLSVSNRKFSNGYQQNVFIKPENPDVSTRKSLSSPVNDIFNDSIYFSPQQDFDDVFHSTQLSQSMKYTLDETIYFTPQNDDNTQSFDEENEDVQNKSMSDNNNVQEMKKYKVISTNEYDKDDDLIDDFDGIIKDFKGLDLKTKEMEKSKSSDFIISTSQQILNSSSAKYMTYDQRLIHTEPKKIKTRQDFNMPMIMLTGFNKNEVTSYSRIIKKLKGKVVTNAETCTHLICHKPHRTLKLLTAIHFCKYVLSTEWIDESNKKGYFVDESDYWYNDEEFVSNYNVNFKESIRNREKNGKPIFDGMDFYITSNVQNYKHLKSIIKCGGGNLLNTLLNKGNSNPIIVIVSSNDEISNYKGNYKYVYDEFIYESSVKQNISWDNEVKLDMIDR